MGIVASSFQGQDWLNQVFSAKSVTHGGVIRRKIVDVEREINLATLELEVRKRGFHLMRSGHHYIIICHSGPIEFVC